MFGIFIFDCMWVWNGFLSLFLLLSLFFSCHLSGPQIYWHDMSKCSVCTLCIFFLSFSYLLLWHLLVCGWFILIYFILFWFILFLYFCYGLVCKFFSFFCLFFWWVVGVCLSRYMACTSIMYWKWVPSPPIPECMIVSVPWAKET